MTDYAVLFKGDDSDQPYIVRFCSSRNLAEEIIAGREGYSIEIVECVFDQQWVHQPLGRWFDAAVKKSFGQLPPGARLENEP